MGPWYIILLIMPWSELGLFEGWGEGGSLSVTRQPWCYVMMHFSSAVINAGTVYSVQHCSTAIRYKSSDCSVCSQAFS